MFRFFLQIFKFYKHVILTLLRRINYTNYNGLIDQLTNLISIGRFGLFQRDCISSTFFKFLTVLFPLTSTTIFPFFHCS